MNLLRKPFAVILFLALVPVLGCAKTEKPAEPPVSTPTPTPKPRIGATAENVRFGWSDTKGDRVADIAAKSGAGTVADSNDALAQLRDARATLYQKGQPVAVLSADTITGDNKTRIMTATGNARIETLNPADGVPSDVRADRIVWEYDKNQVTGSGNVLYTKGNVLQIPASTITGDTKLKQFRALNESDTPGTGNF